MATPLDAGAVRPLFDRHAPALAREDTDLYAALMAREALEQELFTVANMIGPDVPTSRREAIFKLVVDVTPSAHPSVRRFLARSVQRCARESPDAFRRSPYFTQYFPQLLSVPHGDNATSESVGGLDLVAAAAVTAVGADDSLLGPLVDAVPTEEGRVDALLRLSSVALSEPANGGVHPLAAGYVAGALAERATRAAESGDILLLVTIATATLAASKYAGVHRLGQSFIKLCTATVADGSPAEPLLVPYVLKGIGYAITKDASPGGQNTVQFAPALVAMLDRQAALHVAVHKEHSDAWYVAVAGLLSTGQGAEALVQPTKATTVADRLALVATAVRDTLRYAPEEARVAGLHVVGSAAACRPLRNTAFCALCSAPPFERNPLVALVCDAAAPSTSTPVQLAGFQALCTVVSMLVDAQLLQKLSTEDDEEVKVLAPVLAAVCRLAPRVVAEALALSPRSADLDVRDVAYCTGVALQRLERPAFEGGEGDDGALQSESWQVLGDAVATEAKRRRAVAANGIPTTTNGAEEMAL